MTSAKTVRRFCSEQKKPPTYKSERFNLIIQYSEQGLIQIQLLTKN